MSRFTSYKARHFRRIADRWERYPRLMTAGWVAAFGLSLYRHLRRASTAPQPRRDVSWHTTGLWDGTPPTPWRPGGIGYVPAVSDPHRLGPLPWWREGAGG